MLHYIVGPEKQWWHVPLSSFGIRYSFTLAAATAVGIIRTKQRLRFGAALRSQEKLALMMLALMWVLALFGPETMGRYATTDHATVKILKVVIFCLMMTHVVTKRRDLDKIFWILVVGSFLLGLQAYDLPRRAFTSGRLDGRVGGSDFLDANALGLFMAVTVPIIGALFMRSTWRGKLLCGVAGAFSLNTLVLCRGRGAFLGLCAGGIVMLFMAPRRLRIRIAAGLLLASAGLLYVSDTQFLERVSNIITHAESASEGREISDRSAASRIEIWEGGLRMFMDHPLGVGPGNFNQNIGRYAPAWEGFSPHSLYVQALAELGIAGFLLLGLLLLNALWTLRRGMRGSETLPESERLALQWGGIGLCSALAVYSGAGLTGHHMYLEHFWWFLLLPVCFERAVENAREDLLASERLESEA
ncbi:MAG: O-antigen ligase family protein [Deferrisomatales bacterium]|nr:O-antigen ligase family protein [Deferrisomatales bacterium]